jgi:hypothetical protein
MSDPRLSRGYRNKNPGNIDYNERNKWQGQIGIEPAPSATSRARFAVFESHEYGIRALAMLLITYQDRHGLNTVRKIINRWAPSNENNTSAYVSGVAGAMNVGPDEAIDLHKYEVLKPLTKAIITHELGGQPYTEMQIDEGLRRAGVPRPVRTITDAVTTQTGAGAITVAGAASAAAAAAPAVEAVGGLPVWVGVALVLAVAAIAAIVILSKRRDRDDHQDSV